MKRIIVLLTFVGLMFSGMISPASATTLSQPGSCSVGGKVLHTTASVIDEVANGGTPEMLAFYDAQLRLFTNGVEDQYVGSNRPSAIDLRSNSSNNRLYNGYDTSDQMAVEYSGTGQELVPKINGMKILMRATYNGYSCTVTTIFK